MTGTAFNTDVSETEHPKDNVGPVGRPSPWPSDINFARGNRQAKYP